MVHVKLQELYLGANKFSADTNLSFVSSFPSLQKLDMCSSGIEAASLVPLASIKEHPEFQELYLNEIAFLETGIS